MKLTLHHVGIVATSREQIESFRETLGLTQGESGFLEEYNAESIFLGSGSGPSIQFLLPGGGVLKNFNGGRGGIHHIAFCAADLMGTEAELKAKGVDFLNGRAVKGIGEIRFDFAFPNIEGINVEFVEDRNFKD